MPKQQHSTQNTGLANSDVQGLQDRLDIQNYLQQPVQWNRVTSFVAGPGIHRLKLQFDILRLQSALTVLLSSKQFGGNGLADGFGVIAVNQRPGQQVFNDNDFSGRYWSTATDDGPEIAHEDIVDEAAYSELVPIFHGTYFENIFNTLQQYMTVGRMRLLSKSQYNCNSWHRDPEPRIHIPIISNPGSLFVVNNHCTYLPADGSVYFTDTRGYHTALNGGAANRVHLVAAIAGPAPD